MQSRLHIGALGLFVLVLVFWLGLLVHRDPRFAGGTWGGFFGVTATVLMLVSAAYTLVKRMRPLNHAITHRYHMSALLQAHALLALAGALLVFVHSGHAFRSALGIALTTAMLATVLTGFVGQYYLRYVAENVRESEAELEVLARGFEIRSRALARSAEKPRVSMQAVVDLIPFAEATADLQYSVQFQNRVRRLFGAWRTLHIVCAIVFFMLLGLHIWSGFYFGLRWFE
jgi:hypothetical protein